MRRCRQFSRMVAAAAVVGALAASGAAAAQQRVGISSAVNPQAIGTPPGAAARPLVIGEEVVFNERIATTAKGQTQLLFVDESSMSVGPNSDLTIDQFVYDPKTGTGRLAMSATRGLLRYVGGKLSKHDGAVTLRTNTATLAVRGGAFIVNITAGGTTQIIFIYGNGLTVAGVNGAVETLTRAGYQVTITPAGAMSSPTPVPATVLGALTSELDGEPGETGGATTVPTNETVAQQTGPLSRTLSETLSTVFNTTPLNQLTTINAQNAQQNFNQQPNITGIVCTNGGNNCSLVVGGTTTVTGTTPPATGTTPPGPSHTSIVYGGQVTGTSDRSVGFARLAPPASGDVNGTVAYATGTLTYTAGAPQSAVFSGTFGNFGAISFPLPLCSTGAGGGCSGSFGPAGTASAFGTFSGTSFMSADDSFFYAVITPTGNPAARLFLFGGAPVDSGFYQPTGNTRIYAFTIQPDAALLGNMPFVRSQSGGNLANAAVSPFYIVAPPLNAIGDTSSAAGARSLQASLAITGQGANQQSAIAVTTGTIGAQSNGQPSFSGALRGSSLMSATGTPSAIRGTVSSAVDGNGVSLYGGNSISGVVLSQSPSGVAEVPLSGNSTAYGFAQPALPAALPAGVGGSRTTQALSGYFGGIMYSSAQPTAPYVVAGNALISTDAPNNRVEAALAGSVAGSGEGGVSTLTLHYGGLTGTAGNQAFVDDNTFAAAESPTGAQSITINGTTRQAAGQLYLVSAGATTQPANPASGQAAVNPADRLLPAGAAYCQCQYLKWGYWGGSLSSPNADGTPRIDAAHINTWVAGSMTPLADLQTLAGQGITASYTGAALGSVFNNGASYLAAGGFNARYNFGTHAGSFAITGFDGHNFAMSGSAPLNGASYSFGGTAGGFAGAVNGSFYGPRAAETGGNFAFHSVAGPSYLAAGVFAGRQTGSQAARQ